MAEVVLHLKNISKYFGSAAAVDDLSLEVYRGEAFTLLGPSGCGKTTTLRLVGGLERPDKGEIVYEGQTIVSLQKRIFLPPHRRHMGMVFQSYAIWPNMTIWQNVAYPLKLRKTPSATIRDKVAQVLELVGLLELADRPAPLLSGGQQQRVALARALVYEPSLLLLDEPFSNLDAKLREQMRVDLKILQKKLQITVMFVTHDQIEALSLSDRIVVMNRGRAEQIGRPQDLYDQPQTSFVRDFLGKAVLMRGKVVELRHGKARVSLDRIPNSDLLGTNHSFVPETVGQPVYVALRPEAITAETGDARTDAACDNELTGKIEALLFVGDRFESSIQVGGERLFFYLPRSGSWHEGQKIRLTFPDHAISLWPA
jgi:ABC-type Fe3+/spermidine/putrescine transport system ATPase subunit